MLLNIKFFLKRKHKLLKDNVLFYFHDLLTYQVSFQYFRSTYLSKHVKQKL